MKSLIEVFVDGIVERRPLPECGYHRVTHSAKACVYFPLVSQYIVKYPERL